MSEELRAALTADDWQYREFCREYKDSGGWPMQTVIRALTGGALEIRVGDCQRDVTVSTPDLPALIALANAARADDDPGKLTREDVDDLRAVLLMADVRAGSAANVLHRATAAIAKLAAILPPEGTDG